MICLLLFTLTNSLWEDQLHTLQICRPFKVSRAQVQVNLWFPTSDTHMCMHAQLLSHVWLLVIPWTIALQAPLPIRFPSKNTGVGCHFLLQGVFPTQGSNPSLLNHRCILYCWATEGHNGLSTDCESLKLGCLPWKAIWTEVTAALSRQERGQPVHNTRNRNQGKRAVEGTAHPEGKTLSCQCFSTSLGKGSSSKTPPVKAAMLVSLLHSMDTHTSY